MQNSKCYQHYQPDLNVTYIGVMIKAALLGIYLSGLLDPDLLYMSVTPK